MSGQFVPQPTDVVWCALDGQRVVRPLAYRLAVQPNLCNACEEALREPGDQSVADAFTARRALEGGP